MSVNHNRQWIICVIVCNVKINSLLLSYIESDLILHVIYVTNNPTPGYCHYACCLSVGFKAVHLISPLSMLVFTTLKMFQQIIILSSSFYSVCFILSNVVLRSIKYSYFLASDYINYCFVNFWKCWMIPAIIVLMYELYLLDKVSYSQLIVS